MSLYWHAARVVRPRQLAARALRPWRRRRFPAATATRIRPLIENDSLWRSEAFAPLDARPGAGSRLEFFHRHYGEDVLAAARDGRDAAAAAAAWIAADPTKKNDAWHPYPLSTRVSSWIAAATLDERVTPVVADSLARQLAHLALNVEDDILGNHVIRNAKALVLGGVALQDDRLRARGLKLLARELPEQVLPDGGHYERSPAYHRLVLRDLLELQPFAPLGGAIEAMTSFASASSRPDGAPALFNDGGLDLAPRLQLPEPPEGLSVFPDTGYAFLREGDFWLGFDCGAPAPDFLPAHAHADALSFQLWLSGEPVVVDAGTSTYEPGVERARERATRGHSTIAVNGDQFRIWGAFRAGPLPRVRLLEAAPNRLTGEVQLRGGVVHRRTLELDADALVVRDRVDGPAGRHRLVSTLPLARGAEPSVQIDAPVPAREQLFPYAERFGERLAGRALVVRLESQLPLELGWRIARR